ncbi:glucokinase [Acidihalobacter prosperus]
MKLLAADIGGTKTFLKLARYTHHGIEDLHQARFSSADYEHFPLMVSDFLARVPSGPHHVSAACFALAGPIQTKGDHQQAQLTNLPWQLDSLALEESLNIPEVRLINDFAAIGHALPVLPATSLITLQEGQPQSAAPQLVVGAGTGLGVCTLCPTSRGHFKLLPAEAGHAVFSPANTRQLRLAEFVFSHEGHCTREYLCSGNGLKRIYAFICQENGNPVSDPLETSPSPADITRMALDQKERRATQALDLFVEIYAGQTADLALAVLPFGGVYLAGGIAPKILHRLQQGDFVAAFTDRPPMQDLLRQMPVQVIVDEHAGVAGALEYARQLTENSQIRQD